MPTLICFLIIYGCTYAWVLIENEVCSELTIICIFASIFHNKERESTDSDVRWPAGPYRPVYSFYFFLLNTIIDPRYDTMYTCQPSSRICKSLKALITGLIGDNLSSDTHIIYKLKSDAWQTFLFNTSWRRQGTTVTHELKRMTWKTVKSKVALQ